MTLTSGDVDLTVNVRFNNELKTGSIKINKQSEDNQNGGREFTVTGNGKTYSIKTGSDGIAILSDIPIYDSNNNKITYTISEKNVPLKYVVPADQTATLTADATSTKTFKNVLKKFTAQVTKQDSETVSAQGDGTLAGAVYGIYRDSELVDTYTTDENGYFKTKEYVCGNYTVQEISPSEGEPDRRHHPALHAGRRPDPQLHQRPASRARARDRECNLPVCRRFRSTSTSICTDAGTDTVLLPVWIHS